MNIPDLSIYPRWVCWRLESRGGKPTKIPKQINGANADATDPTTWTDYQTALNAYTDRPDRFNGIGFVLGGGFCGVDLDDSIEAGTLKPYAVAIVAALSSYSEVSPSGNGIKIFLRADPLPRIEDGGRRVATKTAERGKIEMYSESRFFTLTGRHLAGTPRTIEDRAAQFAGLYESLFPPRKPTTATSRSIDHLVNRDDAELIELVTRDPKYAALWRGDLCGYGSQSEADLALCGRVAFFAGNDPARVENLFSQSGLGQREKWTDRADYRGRTVALALTGKVEFYNPTARRSTRRCRTRRAI